MKPLSVLWIKDCKHHPVRQRVGQVDQGDDRGKDGGKEEGWMAGGKVETAEWRDLRMERESLGVWNERNRAACLEGRS